MVTLVKHKCPAPGRTAVCEVAVREAGVHERLRRRAVGEMICPRSCSPTAPAFHAAWFQHVPTLAATGFRVITWD